MDTPAEFSNTPVLPHAVKRIPKLEATLISSRVTDNFHHGLLNINL
jgi:hypothetical protein